MKKGVAWPRDMYG